RPRHASKTCACPERPGSMSSICISQPLGSPSASGHCSPSADTASRESRGSIRGQPDRSDSNLIRPKPPLATHAPAVEVIRITFEQRDSRRPVWQASKRRIIYLRQQYPKNWTLRERFNWRRIQLYMDAGRAGAPAIVPLLFGLAEAHLARQVGALLCVVGRHHRIVGRKVPLLAVFLRRHVISRAQMTLQRFELLAIFQADEVIVGNRAADRNGRLQVGLLFDTVATPDLRQR